MKKYLKLHWNKVEFSYHGDEVIYVFIWARKHTSQRYFSIGFNSYFPSLKALDNLWDEYFKTEKEFWEIVYS